MESDLNDSICDDEPIISRSESEERRSLLLTSNSLNSDNNTHIDTYRVEMQPATGADEELVWEDPDQNSLFGTQRHGEQLVVWIRVGRYVNLLSTSRSFFIEIDNIWADTQPLHFFAQIYFTLVSLL